jgi:benzoyl-CoA-dihydrodiol lyase
MAEGVRGKRAIEWRLIDELAPRSKFEAAAFAAAERLAQGATMRDGPGVELASIEPERQEQAGVYRATYRYVTVDVDHERRVATLTVRGPKQAPPANAQQQRAQGAELWALRAFRELDDALLDLRVNRLDAGVVVLKTQGEAETVLQTDRALLDAAAHDWFCREVVLKMRRVLKRLELTARTLFAVIEPGSCFAGSLFELALAADRSYILDAANGPTVRLSPMNFGPVPMSNGLTRLATRFLGEPGRVSELERRTEPLDAADALAAGLVTFAPDDIDWNDEVRLAIEERAAFSPDALTAMEANLRFAGPETLETKIFGRLSAWQNWIFVRPNAVGAKGALTSYGKPERPEFDFVRT